MADEAELQARIAALAGAINRHKQQQQPDPAPHHAQNYYLYNPPYRGNHQYNNRWAPFPAPRGRGRGGYGATYQNRTLVNATISSTPPTPTGQHTPQPQQQQAYPSRQERVTTVHHHSSTPPINRDMVIEGVRFSLLEDGSKLVRMTGEPWNMLYTWTVEDLPTCVEMSETAPPTPRKAIVAGVEFLRTKNNNLLRRPVINVASKYATLDDEERMNPTDNFPDQQQSRSCNASTSSRMVFHRDYIIQLS